MSQTSAALRGRLITLLRVAQGLAVAEAASRPIPLRDVIEGGVTAALRTWGYAVDDRSHWLAASMEPRRWHVARVRTDVPAPPPAGRERRRPERLVLELAGLSLGALERMWAQADQATVYLCDALARLDTCLERARGLVGVTAAVRAHWLADLAAIADSIQSALDAA